VTTNQRSTHARRFTPNTVYDIDFVSGTMGEAAGVMSSRPIAKPHLQDTLSGNWTDAGILILLSNDVLSPG
jgi:hypothetical protein